MWSNIREWLINTIKSRSFLLGVIFILMSSALLYRVFYLQIVKGEEYQQTFSLFIQKNVTTSSTRGTIYDRNGEVLAYSQLSYSVSIEDNGTYENASDKQHEINTTIYNLIKLVEKNGDSVVNDFDIIYQNGVYSFTKEGNQLLRFKADVYGRNTIGDLKTKEEIATASEIIGYLCGENRYKLNDENYTEEEKLKVLTIRYNMASNSFKRYVKTTVAENVNENTVAAVYENMNELQGVSIEESSLRIYPDPEYFSSIIGYIGKASTEEIDALNQELGKEKYELNDIVGKSGIEQYMENVLQGTKGSQIISVDSVGNVIEVENSTLPLPGNDVYLTIDKDLTMACYDILEQKIAGILVSKIKNIKEYSSTGNATDIEIPIYEVYYSLFENHIIDTLHFTADDATDLEKSVLSRHDSKLENVQSQIREELTKDSPAVYKSLSKEMMNYQTYIVNNVLSGDNAVLNADSADPMYTTWHTDESISLKAYLEYAISKNWIDVTKFSVSTEYLDSEEIYQAILDYIEEQLNADNTFGLMLYKYMLLDDIISGSETARLLYDQSVLEADDTAYAKLSSGGGNAYSFFIDKISTLEITPAMLALDPCSGGMVVTAPDSGDVLACVTYPGYDNNKLTNTMDSDYYSELLSDNSKPLYSRATQETTAPGSTFKPVSAMAGLEEGVITLSDVIVDRGEFDKVSNKPRCWIYTQYHSTHGPETVITAIRDSCNYFFYEVGWRLGSETGKFSNEDGLVRLRKYAEMFGLGEKSGIETAETEPRISDEFIVPSAIGQGTHNYTVSQLSRYVSTLANGGTCYNLTILDKLTDSDGNLVEDYSASVYNELNVGKANIDAVREGMHEVAQNTSSLSTLGISSAGKTGTAQQSLSHPNHALFIGFAPFENPEISVAIRIANGYTSANSAEIAADVYNYYFGLKDKKEILNGTASQTGAAIGD